MDKAGANFEADLELEVEYVYRGIQAMSHSEERFGLLDDQVKDRIKKVLIFFRQNNFDVPFIAKYRFYEYSKALDEKDIWTIFNLSQEYGRYRAQYMQTYEHFSRIFRALSDAAEEKNVEKDLDELKRHWYNFEKQVQSLDELKLYQPLIQYLRQYYEPELQELEQAERRQDKILPSMKSPFEFVKVLRAQSIPKMAFQAFLTPKQFTENVLTSSKEIDNEEGAKSFFENIQILKNGQQENYEQVVGGIRRLLPTLYSVQPALRKNMKRVLYEHGYLSTSPTEAGDKVIDIFHESIRVKHINQLKLSDLNKRTDDGQGDIFLDVIQNENKKLIQSIISIDEGYAADLIKRFTNMILSDNCHPLQREVGQEIVEDFLNKVLIPDLVKEIRAELQEQAENYVIRKCQQRYQEMLFTPPFSRLESKSDEDGFAVKHVKYNKRDDSELIADRPRCSVMGVVFNQLDQVTSVVTIVVVDMFGEVRAHHNLQKLIPPRKLRGLQGQQLTEDEKQRQNKAKMYYEEELKEHILDKDKVKELIKKNNVDLIVVGANSLEARVLKQTLVEIAESLKTLETQQGAETGHEAFVIWGGMEVPRLFANSYLCQKLLKGVTDPCIKQAVSLARWEQDPMNEILNLWSFILQENQALQLNLHPMQRFVNQAKLQESLEEANIRSVNSVGIDINLLVDHEHMHIILSFASGLGPRKAKKLISTLKQKSSKINMRGAFFVEKLVQADCYFSLIAFLKIRVAPEDMKNGFDILDQTRIHPESYTLAMKIASDIEFNKDSVDTTQKVRAVYNVIRNPAKINSLDLENYRKELEMTHQENMLYLINYIIEEFRHPFADPRGYRTTKTAIISPERLIYMLTDETPRTLRPGVIVTATVIRVAEGQGDKKGFALAKLDNGLDARIDMDSLDASTSKKIEELIQPGHVVSGRIKEIRAIEESKLGVTLNCRKKVLETHDEFKELLIGKYIEVTASDLINPVFKTDSRTHSSAHYQPRRINHPKFKNVNSNKAITLLNDQQSIGDFIFRPSSRGNNNLTLSWKFNENNIVHIDIQEHDKAPGATIGSRLQIGRDDYFENLQEIVERYIVPCNKLVQDAKSNIKFVQAERTDQLETQLKQEKAAEPSRIPYKITILPDYPQHVVLGYIPKAPLVKEYIKVKPKGFWFHDTHHKSIQALINWFKDNYKKSDYVKAMKRQRSPRAKIEQMSQKSKILVRGFIGEIFALPDAMRDSSDQQMVQNSSDNAWANLQGEWAGGGRTNRTGSVHSLNADGDHVETRPAPAFQSMGNSSFGRGHQRPSGPIRIGDTQRNLCFNCNEPGHMSRECPKKSERRQYGSARPRADYNQQSDSGNNWGGNNASSTNQGYAEAQQPAWDNQQVNQSYQTTESVAWSQQYTSQPVQAVSGWGGGQQDQPMQEAWGSSDQAQQPAAGSGWGQNQAADSNWNSGNGGGFADQDQNNDDRGRGRARGFRGGRGGADGGAPRSNNCFKCGQEGHFSRECPNQGNDSGARGRGGGGGSRECYKCHQEGHMARDCPNQDAGDRGAGRGRGRGPSGACHRCNQEGHFARECPNANDQGGYKRQRRDDGGSNHRGNGDEPRDNDNWGGNHANDQAWSGAGGDANDAWNQKQNNNYASNNNNGQQWGAASSNSQPPADAWGGNNGGW